jgi:hypothetical protein
VTFARERDAALTNEDHIRLVLDTFRDARSGYVFAINANGARYDALVSGNGESENANWDAPWQAATQQSDAGWSAEILIPIKSILFKPGQTAWGFNVQRRVQALQETQRWASAFKNIKVTQTGRAGLLIGLPAFDLGVGASIRPALTGGGLHDSAASPFRGRNKASLDVTQRFGANTLASLTVNTDFAETRSTRDGRTSPAFHCSPRRSARSFSKAPTSSRSASGSTRTSSCSSAGALRPRSLLGTGGIAPLATQFDASFGNVPQPQRQGRGAG